MEQAMTTWNAFRRRFMAAAVAVSVAASVTGTAMDWRPRDELINRPAGPFACLPGDSLCEPRM